MTYLDLAAAINSFVHRAAKAQNEEEARQWLEMAEDEVVLFNKKFHDAEREILAPFLYPTEQRMFDLEANE